MFLSQIKKIEFVHVSLIIATFNWPMITSYPVSDPSLPAGHIQANLEDELVQEALRKGLDLRQYSREIESELRKVELRSIEDCIHPPPNHTHVHSHSD